MPPRKRAAASPQPTTDGDLVLLEYLGPHDSVDVSVPGFARADVWAGETIEVAADVAGTEPAAELDDDGQPTGATVPGVGLLASPESWRVADEKIPAAKKRAAAAAAADTDTDEE